METNQYKQIVKRLTIIFFVVFIIVSIICNVYVVSEMINQKDAIHMLSGYQVFSLLLGLFVYIPLMIAIHRYAQLANMKKATLCSKIALWYLAIYEVIALIVTGAEIWKRFGVN